MFSARLRLPHAGFLRCGGEMAIHIGTMMLDVRGDVAALHADVQQMNVIVRRGFDQMGADMRRAEQASRQFAEQLRGASLGLRGLVAEAAGLAGVGSALSAALAVPRAGVKYAAEMETMQLGMAGTLASMGQIDGKAISIGKAMEISAQITGRLQQKAMETSANMHELVGAYQAIIGPGLQAGASLEKMVDFVTAGTVAVKSMGLKSGQVVQELRDLVQGGIQPASSTLATAIGVSDKDIKEIKAKGGDLIGFLMDRMKGFSEASTLYAQTFTGRVSAMQEAFSILSAKGTAPIFESLKQGIDGVMNAMGTTKEIVVKNGDEIKKSMTWTVDPKVVAQIGHISLNMVEFADSALSVGRALWSWREPIGYALTAMLAIKGMRIAGAVGNGVIGKVQEIRASIAENERKFQAERLAASGEVERAKAIQMRAAADAAAARQRVDNSLSAAEKAYQAQVLAKKEIADAGRAVNLAQSHLVRTAGAGMDYEVARVSAANQAIQQHKQELIGLSAGAEKSAAALKQLQAESTAALRGAGVSVGKLNTEKLLAKSGVQPDAYTPAAKAAIDAEREAILATAAARGKDFASAQAQAQAIGNAADKNLFAAKAAKLLALEQKEAALSTMRQARDAQANLVRQAGLGDAGEAERLAAAQRAVQQQKDQVKALAVDVKASAAAMKESQREALAALSGAAGATKALQTGKAVAGSSGMAQDFLIGKSAAQYSDAAATALRAEREAIDAVSAARRRDFASAQEQSAAISAAASKQLAAAQAAKAFAIEQQALTSANLKFAQDAASAMPNGLATKQLESAKLAFAQSSERVSQAAAAESAALAAVGRSQDLAAISAQRFGESQALVSAKAGLAAAVSEQAAAKAAFAASGYNAGSAAAADYAAAESRLAEAQARVALTSEAEAAAATAVARANQLAAASAVDAAAQQGLAMASSALRAAEAEHVAAAAALANADGHIAQREAAQALVQTEARLVAAREAFTLSTREATAAEAALAGARDAEAAAANANTAANERLALSTNQLAAAKEREAAAASMAAMAGRAASGVLAALGGPIGIAILGVSMLAIYWDDLKKSMVLAADTAEDSVKRIKNALAAGRFAEASAEKAAAEKAYKQNAQELQDVNAVLADMRSKGQDKTMPDLYRDYLGKQDKWAAIADETRRNLGKITKEINDAKEAQSSAALKNVELYYDPRDIKAGALVKGNKGVGDARDAWSGKYAGKGAGVDLSTVKPRFDKAYKDYMEGEGGLTTTKAEDRAKKLEKENEQFQLAIKDYQVGSKEYEDAVKTHKARIAFINKEDKGGNNLSSEARLVAAEAAKLKQAEQELATLLAEGQKKAPLMDGEKAALRYQELAEQAKKYGKVQQQIFYEDEARDAAERGKVERKVQEQRKLNQLRLQFKADDEKRVLDQQLYNEEAANEVRWLALSNTERAAAQAAWDVEKKSRQDILELQKEQRELSSKSAKQEIADRIAVLEQRREEDKLQAAGRARQQAALQEWSQIGSDIERALTDSISRGFDGGRSSLDSLKKALLDIPKTLMVRLLVQPVMSEVNRLGAQLIGGQGVGGAGSAGGMSLDSMLGLGKLAGQAGDGLNWLGDALGMDSLKSLGSSLNSLMGNASSASSALEGVGSFLGSSSAYGGSLSGMGGSAANGLSGWSSGVSGAGNGWAGLGSTTPSLASNSAAFDSVAAASTNSVSSGASGAASSASNLASYASYAMAAYNVFNSFKTGKGWGATIGSMASFIPGLGPIAGVVGSLVGGLIDNAFGSKGGPKSGGNANAVFDASGNVLARNMFGGYTPDQLDSSFTDQLKTLQGNYATLTKALGGTVQSLTMNLGGDQDPQGSAGNRVSAQVALGSVGVGMGSGDAERALWDKALYSSVSKSVSGDFNAAVKLETTRMLVAALKASDLPEEVSKFLGEIDLPNATQDQLDTLVSKAQALAALGKVFEQFASVLPALAGGSLTAKERLVSLSGGLDALASGLASYRDAYFSDAEKQSATREQIGKTLAEVGLALPATQVEFRKLLESLDPMTESGAKATTTMLSVANAFAQVSLSATQVKTLNTAFDGLGSLWAGLSGSGQAARLEMVSVAGGLDALTGRLTAYQKGFYSQEEQRQLALTALRGEFAALGQVMPASVGEFRKLVQGIDTSTTAGRTLVTQLLGLSSQFAELTPSIAEMDKLSTAFVNLGRVMPGLAGSSERARLAIANFGGGIDALAAGMDGYRTNFYSQSERDAATYRQVAASLAEVGLSMPASREAFRQLVEGLDQSTDRGKKAFAVLMGVQDAFASITPAADAASSAASAVTTTLGDLAKGLQDEFSAAADKARATLEKLKQATDGRLDVEQWLAKSQGKGAEWIAARQADLWKMYGQAVSPEQQLELLQELKGLTYEKYQTEIDAVKELTNNASKLRDAAKNIREYVLGLKVGELSPATMGERMAEAASQYYVTLAQAKAGDQTALSAITGKASAYLDLSKQYYGSSDPYSGAGGVFAQVTGSLDGLGVSLDAMAGGQDLAAAQAQAQLRYSAQAIAEMQRLREGFSSVEGLLQAQLLKQTADAAAILGRMRDDDILTALRGLPAELATLIKGAWMGSGSPSAGPGTNLGSTTLATTTTTTGQATTGGATVAPVIPGSTITRFDAPVDTTPKVDPARQTVESWYQTVLGRPGDASGVDYWSQLLRGQGEAQAYSAFFAASATERTVRDAYQQVLGRRPDDAGMSYWVGQLQGGMSYDQFYATLSGSAEALARIPQFAVGTNELPADMLALVHAGERIMPAADNAELMARLSEPSSFGDGLSVLAVKLDKLILTMDEVVSTLQQHGMMTVGATQAGAAEVVEGLRSQVQEMQWKVRSAPTMA